MYGSDCCRVDGACRRLLHHHAAVRRALKRAKGLEPSTFSLGNRDTVTYFSCFKRVFTNQQQ